MSLIDDLRKLGNSMPPSHVPGAAEIQGVLGALVAYAEHGPAVLTAFEKGAQELSDLLGDVKPEPEPSHPAVPSEPVATVTPPAAQAGASTVTTPVPPVSDSDDLATLKAENAALQQQVATLLANLQKTQVTVESTDGQES
jgi:hypothetical protein